MEDRTKLDIAMRKVLNAINNAHMNKHDVADKCRNYVALYDEGTMTFKITDHHGIVKYQTDDKLPTLELNRGYLGYKFHRSSTWYNAELHTVTKE